MITRYNLRQTLLALSSAMVGVLAFWIGWHFFRWAFAIGSGSFGFRPSAVQSDSVAWIAVAIIAVSGFCQWRQGEGYRSLSEVRSLRLGQPVTGFGWMVHRDVNRVAAWSYILSQIFLAGPLQILRAWERLCMRIPNEPTMESGLFTTLDELKRKGKWMEVSEFPGREIHIAYLAQLGLVDFSARKGTVKAR